MMHESTMTADEVRVLREDVMTFYVKYRGTEVSRVHAEHFFEGLGHTLTRPIDATLRAHGVVTRSSVGKQWPHGMQPHPWDYDHEREMFVPTERAT